MTNALNPARTTPLHTRAFLLLAITPFLACWAVAASFVEPEEAPFISEDGTVPLVWSESDPDVDYVYEVRRWQLGGDPVGMLVYEGEDTASFVSGLGEGDYVFKLRSKRHGSTYPDWNDEGLEVKVDYIDMAIVWPLMGAGFVCFFVLLATIFFGRRAALREETTRPEAT